MKRICRFNVSQNRYDEVGVGSVLRAPGLLDVTVISWDDIKYLTGELSILHMKTRLGFQTYGIMYVEEIPPGWLLYPLNGDLVYPWDAPINSPMQKKSAAGLGALEKGTRVELIDSVKTMFKTYEVGTVLTITGRNGIEYTLMDDKSDVVFGVWADKFCLWTEEPVVVNTKFTISPGVYVQEID